MDDFLIIGGGIAGVSAAAVLSDLGRVTLLEAEPHLGTQASGRSAAVFLAPYGSATVRALNAASAPVLEAAGVLRQRGLLMLAGPGQDDRMEQERALYGAEAIALETAAELWPILRREAAVSAALYSGARDIDTDLLLQSLALQARRNGAQIRTAAPVTALHRTAEGWRVESGAGESAARMLVNAAGSWADRIAVLAGVAPLGLQPYRRSMARLAAPGGHDTRRWPFVLDISEAWYAKPDAGGWIVSPAEAHPMEPHDAWADDMVLAEGLERYQAFATEPVTRPLATWAGLRTFAPDGALVLGPDPDVPDFVWCAGQGGYGFQSAPAAARLLGDLLGGRASELPPDVVAALRPERLRA